MKKLSLITLVFASMIFGLTNVAKAQIYCNEICYYVNTENENDNEWGMLIVKFSGKEMQLSGRSRSEVGSNLFKSQSFYENDDYWKGGEKKVYCSDKSTSSREVYRGHRMVPYNQPGMGGYKEGEGWRYHAFSLDKSSLIIWEEVHGNITNKRYYVRIAKEDLLPNYDFLND